MEANKFGFGPSMPLPPAFKFDPTEADIVAHYLIPRALNLPNPHADAIKEENPASAPPWEILQRHGNLDQAFFFGPPANPSKNAGRQSRNVTGGKWQGQQSSEHTVTLLHPDGGEVDIRYKRYELSFYRDNSTGRSSGYVMHEYKMLSPPLPGILLTRIKAPKKAKRQQPVVAPASAEHQVQVPDPEQTGPGYEYAAALVMSIREGLSGAQDGAPYGGGMVEHAGYYSRPLACVLPEADYDNNYCVSIQDQPGPSCYNYDAAAMNGAGEQPHALYGDGMVGTSGACYDTSGIVPKCGGDYSNYYAEYQQWQNQQDPSNQYLAGDDAAVMCAGGEQQAGALCGNSDNGSAVGTEASTHSTISLCGDGSFYKFDDNNDLKCEQNGGGDPANE